MQRGLMGMLLPPLADPHPRQAETPLSSGIRARVRAIAPTVSTLLAAACSSIGPSAELAAPAPMFVPQAFFAGRTIGDGVLHVSLAPARPVHVTGEGRTEPDGTLVLIQRVAEGGKPARERTWRLRPLRHGRFAVRLSDATGPVGADVSGNRLHLRFRAKGGLGIEQWIYLPPGGDTALNRMVVRKFGLPVATLRETIRRVP